MVASIIAYSLSGSSARALKRFSQTPFSAQREKRLCVLLQPPKRSGKSRHGAPTRNFQITASTKSRSFQDELSLRALSQFPILFFGSDVSQVQGDTKTRVAFVCSAAGTSFVRLSKSSFALTS